MNRMVGRIGTAAISLLGAAGVLSAQQPVAAGSALGVQGTAVTEARRLDAVLWNPALVGIYDGPEQSHSLFVIDAARVPEKEWWAASAGLGTLTGRIKDTSRVEWLGGVLGGGAPAGGAALNIGWLAVQSRDVALSLTSHYVHSSALPARLFGELAERGVESDAATTAELGTASRSVSSVAAAAKGMYLGRLPVVGQMWVGATAKGWWVHDFSEGRFLGDLPTADVYDEITLRNVMGAGVDLGIAGRAADQLRYGASLSNVYSHIWTPKRGPRVRTVEVREVEFEDGVRLETTDRFGPYQAWEDPDREGAARAEGLWERTRYPSILRVGAAWDTPYGAAAVSWREMVEEGGLGAEWVETPYAAAWTGPSGLPLRLSYGWGAQSKAVAVGIEFGPCDRRWGISAGQHDDPLQGKWYTVSAGLTFAPWSCRMGPV